MFDSSRDCLGRWRFHLRAPSSNRLWRFGKATRRTRQRHSKLCIIEPGATGLRGVANTMLRWKEHEMMPSIPQLTNAENKTQLSNLGTVVSVRGSVVDIRFDQHLPPIYSVLRAGAEKRIVIEVQAQRDEHHVRGIALTPTQGLARGMAAEDTGGPLKAPVGKGVLSRMFNVFGNTIDRGAALSDAQWRSVHRAPPPLDRRSTKSEIFETGIKVIDVLVPLERGGKAGLFGVDLTQIPGLMA